MDNTTPTGYTNNVGILGYPGVSFLDFYPPCKKTTESNIRTN